jgi:hypothetical protein
MRTARREKVFGRSRAAGPQRQARIAAYARTWDRQHASRGQRGGALGRAALDRLGVLLWVFHNARSGACFPSYERIAEKAECARTFFRILNEEPSEDSLRDNPWVAPRRAGGWYHWHSSFAGWR